MLLHLHIRNFAIVPALEQEFRPGFTAISGETGAGKSILVDALGLLLGARSDASWVRSRADRAELTAEFAVTANPAAREWLAEHDLDDGDQCLLRRSIQSSGRSRAWINGTPVPISQLAALGNLLVEVHGQNEHVRLAAPAAQRDLLDRTGGYADDLDAAREAHAAWREAVRALEESAEGAAMPPSELEFLAFQLEELEQVAEPAEAIEALEQEHRLLAAGGALAEALERCSQLLDDDDGSAAGRLQASLAALEPYVELDRSIGEARTMLDEALINTREAATTLTAAQAGLDLDPQRLEAVERRLSRLGDLARKHGVSLEALELVRDRLAERLDAATRFDDIRAELEANVETRLADYRSKDAKLSRARARHAVELAESVDRLMAQLGMAGGRFLIDVQPGTDDEPRVGGNARVAMMVSANPGIDPAPLAKVASGGELSRISLALKVATADSQALTQVFDEIDTGVGGDTANAVGDLLRQVAGTGQALCVTHLAQVAVRADQQLKVIKQAADDSTSVAASVLHDNDRVEEIARMLGGKVSEQSRAHARELLTSAQLTLQ